MPNRMGRGEASEGGGGGGGGGAGPSPIDPPLLTVKEALSFGPALRMQTVS